VKIEPIPLKSVGGPQSHTTSEEDGTSDEDTSDEENLIPPKSDGEPQPPTDLKEDVSSDEEHKTDLPDVVKST
jgi:hypothetical protein